MLFSLNSQWSPWALIDWWHITPCALCLIKRQLGLHNKTNIPDFHVCVTCLLQNPKLLCCSRGILCCWAIWRWNTFKSCQASSKDLHTSLAHPLHSTLSTALACDLKRPLSLWVFWFSFLFLDKQHEPQLNCAMYREGLDISKNNSLYRVMH